MRSSAGLGMTPPNVLGELKPSSSVMISKTLGAPFGGTMRGAHQGVDSEALSLMTPPNGGFGGGSCFPSIVVVAVGEPRTPVTCWAKPPGGFDAKAKANIVIENANRFAFTWRRSHELTRPAQDRAARVPAWQ